MMGGHRRGLLLFDFDGTVIMDRKPAKMRFLPGNRRLPNAKPARIEVTNTRSVVTRAIKMVLRK